MCYKIHYFRNPLDRAWPQQSGRGSHLINIGLRCLKRKLINPNRNINPTSNAKRVIHGLAHLYGFHYQSFMTTNFLKKRKYYYHCHKRCNLATWIIIIHQLVRELKAIFQYSNISSLLRSRYAKYIQIDNIRQYYHPRKKHYVSNARTQLAHLGPNQRHLFTGIFQRFGSKTNGQLTILLTNIQYNHQLVTDHLWFNATKQFRQLGHLDTGEKLMFKARVKRYCKGYLPSDFIKHYDYELTYPSHIQRC